MCLIVFAWRPGHATPLLLAANRDEFYARPCLPLATWPEAPGVHAGRDLTAGGTWLGVGPGGRVAAVTNIRDPSQPLGRRSRGELPAGFLLGDLSPEAYLAQVAERARDYTGFNLLVGTHEELWYYHARETAPRCLPAGLYGISNAGLDTPWPKLRRAKAALAGCLETPSADCLLAAVQDRRPAADAELPDTGVGLVRERLLSSVFIASPDYGTCSSSALIVAADGAQQLVERSFGPGGSRLGEVRLVLP
ncbi:NRDE family protein [Azotobacter salinestris]|uniref:NRDE family protein n=1 Tax=Azotobacter salinestris TaxID=69964 RepID=UPI0032DE981B